MCISVCVCSKLSIRQYVFLPQFLKSLQGKPLRQQECIWGLPFISSVQETKAGKELCVSPWMTMLTVASPFDMFSCEKYTHSLTPHKYTSPSSIFPRKQSLNKCLHIASYGKRSRQWRVTRKSRNRGKAKERVHSF